MKLKLRFTYNKKIIAILKSFPSHTRMWDTIEKCWVIDVDIIPHFTKAIWGVNPKLASQILRSNKYKEIKREHAQLTKEHEQSYIDSFKKVSNKSFPSPKGLNYLPFQKAGIDYILNHPNTLLADEMGLGKTIQTIGVLNSLKPKNIIIVCPSNMKLNWEEELEKWLVYSPDIEIVYGDNFPNSDIIIINYDILKTNYKQIKNRKWDVLIADECHYMKNRGAQRTKVGLKIKARKNIFITGTPILNRPVELYPVANKLSKEFFPTYNDYITRWCNPIMTQYGMDVSGATNIKELGKLLRSTIMIRRTKKQVLKDLPPKFRQVIEIECGEILDYEKTYEQLINKIVNIGGTINKIITESGKIKTNKEYEEIIKELNRDIFSELNIKELGEFSRLRHQTGIMKIPFVLEHIKNLFEIKNKVVLFGHHNDVLETIHQKFDHNSVLYTGKTNTKKKKIANTKFQKESKYKLFVGNIQAGGVGIDLFASDIVVFGEFDPVPGNMTQAEDRLHRYGQKKSVLVQHIVLQGSLDTYLTKLIIRKQNVIDKLLF